MTAAPRAFHSPPMNGTGDGILLGLANTIVIGFCLAISMHEPIAQVMIAVVFLGFIPASIIGMIEGWIGAGLASRARWVRIAALVPMPLGFVLAIGKVLDITAHAYGACIPTLVAVLMLERATRAPQVVPRAVVAG